MALLGGGLHGCWAAPLLELEAGDHACLCDELLELVPIPDDAAPNSVGSRAAGGSMADGRTMGRATRVVATRATRAAALDDLSAGGARRVEAGGSCK